MGSDVKTTMDAYQRLVKKLKMLGVRGPIRHGVTAPLHSTPYISGRTCFNGHGHDMTSLTFAFSKLVAAGEVSKLIIRAVCALALSKVIGVCALRAFLAEPRGTVRHIGIVETSIRTRHCNKKSRSRFMLTVLLGWTVLFCNLPAC